jgi:hypothetical protein
MAVAAPPSFSLTEACRSRQATEERRGAAGRGLRVLEAALRREAARGPGSGTSGTRRGSRLRPPSSGSPRARTRRTARSSRARRGRDAAVPRARGRARRVWRLRRPGRRRRGRVRRGGDAASDRGGRGRRRNRGGDGRARQDGRAGRDGLCCSRDDVRGAWRSSMGHFNVSRYIVSCRVKDRYTDQDGVEPLTYRGGRRARRVCGGTMMWSCRDRVATTERCTAS